MPFAAPHAVFVYHLVPFAVSSRRLFINTPRLRCYTRRLQPNKRRLFINTRRLQPVRAVCLSSRDLRREFRDVFFASRDARRASRKVFPAGKSNLRATIWHSRSAVDESTPFCLNLRPETKTFRLTARCQLPPECSQPSSMHPAAEFRLQVSAFRFPICRFLLARIQSTHNLQPM